MNTIPIQHGQRTWKQLEEIHHFGYSYSTIFTDFVDLCLLALLSLTDNLDKDIFDKLKENRLRGRYEEQYLQLVEKYRENKEKPKGKRPADYFAQAWGYLQQETKDYNHDVLGEIYESQISHGEHGQFFTPVHITDMMCQLVGAGTLEADKTVCDPCVGSGRFFLSMAKLDKDLHFTGVDLSPICAKMTTLNMWLFDLNADIYHGNSISLQMFQVWQVRKGGFISEGKVEAMPEPVKTKIKTQAQQTLFDVDEVNKAA